MEKKKIILVATLLMVTCCVFADKYKVLYLNSPDIKVGNKTIVVGNVFDDKDAIKWTSEQQAMKVMNLNTKRVMVLAAKALKKKKSTSLYEYLTSTKHLSTRDMKKRRMVEEWQIDSTLYLLDTLYIRRPQMREHSVMAKIVLKEDEKKMIPLDNEEQYFIISRKIFGNKITHQIKVDIKEYEREHNWEYTVYRNLIIELLPIQTR